jgi:hypothetical protein
MDELLKLKCQKLQLMLSLQGRLVVTDKEIMELDKKIAELEALDKKHDDKKNTESM